MKMIRFFILDKGLYVGRVDGDEVCFYFLVGRASIQLGQFGVVKLVIVFIEEYLVFVIFELGCKRMLFLKI